MCRAAYGSVFVCVSFIVVIPLTKIAPKYIAPVDHSVR